MQGREESMLIVLQTQMSILDSIWNGGMSAGRTKSDLMMLTQLVSVCVLDLLYFKTAPLRSSPFIE